MSERSSPVTIDPAELWEEWLAETDKKYRTPQSALAFAVDRMSRASLQPATKPEGCDPCGYPECGCQGRPATGGDAVAGDAKALLELAQWVADQYENFAGSIARNDPVLKKHQQWLKGHEAVIRRAAIRPDVAGDVQAARAREPEAWQYRMNVGGWLPWHEIDMPMDYFLKKHQIHLDNGSCEMRPLYLDAAQPSEQQRIDDAKRITSAVLNTMTNGGDNLAIYEAVWGSLSSTQSPSDGEIYAMVSQIGMTQEEIETINGAIDTALSRPHRETP